MQGFVNHNKDKVTPSQAGNVTAPQPWQETWDWMQVGPSRRHSKSCLSHKSWCTINGETLENENEDGLSPMFDMTKASHWMGGGRESASGMGGYGTAKSAKDWHFYMGVTPVWTMSKDTSNCYADSFTWGVGMNSKNDPYTRYFSGMLQTFEKDGSVSTSRAHSYKPSNIVKLFASAWTIQMLEGQKYYLCMGTARDATMQGKTGVGNTWIVIPAEWGTEGLSRFANKVRLSVNWNWPDESKNYDMSLSEVFQPDA